MNERIKKFGLRIWDKIEDHLAKYIAVVIISIFVVACIFFWKWLIVKHSLKMYGWLWLLLFLAIALLLILLLVLVFWLVRRKSFTKKLKDSGDIEMAIGNWIRNLSISRKGQTFYYSDVGKELRVSPRRLKAYLEAVAAECNEQVELRKKTFRFIIGTVV